MNFNKRQKYLTIDSEAFISDSFLAILNAVSYCTSIPLNNDWFTTDVNWTTYWPLEFALTVNCSITALFLAPAVAKISKFVNSCVPLMLTLKVREPEVEKKVSAKCSLIV